MGATIQDGGSRERRDVCHTCHSYGHEISDMAEIEICNTMFHVSDAILDNLPSNVSITLDIRLKHCKNVCR